MMGKKFIYPLLFLFLIVSLRSISFAQPPPSQEASGQVRTQQLEQQEQRLRKKVEEKKEAPQIEENLPQPPAPAPSAEKVMIQEIRVTGVTLFPQKKIEEITIPFKNKELTLLDMQKLTDLITDFYRQKGYITSRAYIPPQKIAAGVLEIKVLEGVMGSVQVKGNRFFSTRLLESKITLKKGQPFNYNQLRTDLTKINENPDRTARAVLMPGKEPGSTDMVLDIKDRLPIHAGFDYDNYGSRYIEKNRYTVRVSDSNLLGFDDSLNFQFQMAEESRYYLKSVRYLYPVTPNLNAGFLRRLAVSS